MALQQLSKQRSSIQGSITRLKNVIDSNEHSMNAYELETRLKLVETYFDQALQVRKDIEILDNSQSELEKLNSLEESYCTLKAKMLSLISNKNRKLVPSDKEHQSTSIVPQNHVLKLPNLKLPQFSGKYTEWPSFISRFTTLVEQSDLTKIEKFTHLLSCLSDRPLKIVQALEVTEENYNEALKLLKSRYENKGIIFQAHVKEFFDLSRIMKNSSVQLRDLIDSANVHLCALKSLGNPENILDAFLIHLILSKADHDTQLKWDEHKAIDEVPRWDTFCTFICNRCTILENRDSRSNTNSFIHPNKINTNRRQTSLITSVSDKFCLCCKNQEHNINQCSRFLKFKPVERYYEAKRLSLCLLCLKRGHSVKTCLGKKCSSCGQPHNYLLHRDAASSQQRSEVLKQTPSSQETNLAIQPSCSNPKSLQVSLRCNLNNCERSINGKADSVILATAIVHIKNSFGTFIPCRAILDSASQLNFISGSLMKCLQLKQLEVDDEISGIGSSCTRSKGKVVTTIKSRLNSFAAELDFWILPTITDSQPKESINMLLSKIPDDIDLADPLFYKTNKVDVLLGAGIFFDLLLAGQIKIGNDLPTLQNTLLGWIVSGRMNSRSCYSSLLLSSEDINEAKFVDQGTNIERLLEKFWLIEDIGCRKPRLTKEQELCEIHFLTNIRRLLSGRFLVHLPFRKDPSCLGNSSEIANRRFAHLERRLQRLPDIKHAYSDFMAEYIRLGHMKESDDSLMENSHNFLPHHYVLKPDSSTTKLRSVFDASCRTTSGLSLNDILMVGPSVQPELFDTILRFRLHKYAITADISKMYRQIQVALDDCKYQCIYWRENITDPLKIYQLETVTYGTASAPYLATRCLKYLADNESKGRELGARTIQNDFYVDDMLSGADSIEKTRLIMNQVEEILSEGQFELRKWCSNEPKLLEDIPEDKKEKLVKFNNLDVTKTLGIVWNPVSDEFYFSFACNLSCSTFTKREVLSTIARIFDPLGLINPITVLAKVVMQELWILRIGWDEPIPASLKQKFQQFIEQLQSIHQIKIPRYVFSHSIATILEIHGFSDASERAYGCCIYVRTTDDCGNNSVKLLCAKSRVAPIKTVSLPRLELCGAQLLAQLIARISKGFTKWNPKIVCWTDSKIVLDWLSAHPSSWTTFVANRTSLIQEILPNACWNHVPSSENPADIISRGVMPQKLMTCTSWFEGPQFLRKSPEYWPKRETLVNADVPERRGRKSCLNATGTRPKEDIVKEVKFLNSFKKLRRTFAYMLRFIHNSKLSRDRRLTGELTAEELAQAERTIVWNVQQTQFRQEYSRLDKDLVVSPQSFVKNLNPFLDEDSKKKLIRVGGRLQNAELPFSAKFPILIPHKHPFTSSLITFLHLKYFHAGPQALVAILREKYWITNARDVVRRVVHRCIRCFRSKPILMSQLMGNLPAHRVQPARPFINSGVDFCGPVSIRSNIRGRRLEKAYISLFVCFSTKAVHLEVVSNLSSEAFIAALKRFIARRGHCRSLYCDNATNFVGANRQLKELHEMFNNQQTQDMIVNMCAEDGIDFRPIPPRTPHFGGLWEAGIKSAKMHLHRTINSESLNFEELTTVVAQIEAILNSRPITALSSDPTDLEALTPGHFLTGGPLTAIVEPDLTEINLSRLSRWQKLCALRQHFWKRWSREYIVQLQQRNKWASTTLNLAIGALVLVADDQLPPQKWLLGRVTETFPGSDGKVRVVSINTKNGVKKRAIHKVCILPIET